MVTRRRFAFWIGFGLFSLGERLRAESLDALASAGMRLASHDPVSTERWRPAENGSWRWYERDLKVDDEWRLTGITTPVHKRTGERKTSVEGYLDESLVPVSVKRKQPTATGDTNEEEFEDEHDPGWPDPARRARHGRPPSRWLRSLNSEELSWWLDTIEAPEVGVSGMTFWEHLTRDHSFAEENLQGLLEEELAKLHAAAHYGY